RLGRRHELQRRTVPARAGARARERRGVGQQPDRVAVRWLRGPARGVYRDRAPGERADAAARALQAAVVHRGAACRVRDLGLGLRAVPLHHALPPELPRLLAPRGWAALPAAYARELSLRTNRGGAPFPPPRAGDDERGPGLGGCRPV